MNNQEIIDAIRKKGYKITPQRRAIIETLFQQQKPSTAKEILDVVRLSFPDTSLDTIYRNLNLLVSMGVLIQINLKNNETSRFEVSPNNHHHHLICLGCGESICLESCALSERDLDAAKQRGFEVVGHVFEIYGYCSGCRKTG